MLIALVLWAPVTHKRDQHMCLYAAMMHPHGRVFAAITAVSGEICLCRPVDHPSKLHEFSLLPRAETEPLHLFILGLQYWRVSYEFEHCRSDSATI